MSAGMSEEHLAAEARRGDSRALERLLLDHYAMVARHVERVLRDSNASALGAEDVLQETFAQAFRDIRTFTFAGPGSFGAWLCAIARNRVRDAVKYRCRHKRRRNFAPASPDGIGAERQVDQFGTDSGTPSKIVAHREATRAMKAAIDRLHDQHRRVVVLRYLEGRSLEQISAAIGRSPAAVHGLLDRAKRELRRAMGRSSLYFTRK